MYIGMMRGPQVAGPFFCHLPATIRVPIDAPRMAAMTQAKSQFRRPIVLSTPHVKLREPIEQRKASRGLLSTM